MFSNSIFKIFISLRQISKIASSITSKINLCRVKFIMEQARLVLKLVPTDFFPAPWPSAVDTNNNNVSVCYCGYFQIAHLRLTSTCIETEQERKKRVAVSLNQSYLMALDRDTGLSSLSLSLQTLLPPPLCSEACCCRRRRCYYCYIFSDCFTQKEVAVS